MSAVVNPGAWSLPEILKWVIIVAARVAVAIIAVRAMGVQVPGWAVQMFWVVVIAVVALIAINIILSL